MIRFVKFQILFDKMEKLGTKLLITGKGRCNLTHQIGRLEEIFEGYPKGAQFLHSSFNKFPPAELIKFFESRGVKCKPDRGRRIFPASEKSSDICGVLLDELKRGGVSVRLNTPIIEIGNRFIKFTSSYPNLDFDTPKYNPSLHIPKDTYLVKTLCDIYNKFTGSSAEPIAIGGATYARAFDNCISFGPNLPGQKDMCHQTDEFISIDNLILASKIYAEAIFKLSQI